MYQAYHWTHGITGVGRVKSKIGLYNRTAAPLSFEKFVVFRESLMKKPGPKSVAELSTAPIQSDPRLPPPGGLTAPEKAIWVSLVNSRPADWFSDAHIGMLKQYCRHQVNSDVIASQMQEFEGDWLSDDEGLRRYDKLSGMLERETRAMNALLRSMRLTHQSLVRAEKAVPQTNGRKPWDRKIK